MPDTPGKRQRQAAKAKRRETKDERRAARKAHRDDPASFPEYGYLGDEQAVEQPAEPPEAVPGT
jgi:hypothetical protein